MSPTPPGPTSASPAPASPASATLASTNPASTNPAPASPGSASPAPGRSAAPTPPAGSRGIDEILADARARLRRLGPAEVNEALDRGAVLVDIRPAAQRAEFGEIPGALIIERNVLEWRFDPASDARLP